VTRRRWRTLPDFDERLTLELERVARPADPTGVLDRLDGRRARRATVRKARIVFLAVAVLGATTLGFVALRSAFVGSERTFGDPSNLPGNGAIVFSRKGDDGRFHLYAARPDGSGVRQITDDATNDTDPAVSPDGKTIAYAHELDEGLPVVATVPFGSGTVTWQTGGNQAVIDPTWSPDGRQIAFVGSTTDSADLYVIGVNGGEARRIPFSADENDVTPTGYSDFPAHPTWSPAGTRLAVAVHTFGGTFSTSWDLAVVKPDGTGLEWLLATNDIPEEAPAWSPDGTRIAFTRPGERGDEVWTIAPDGSDETLVASAVEASLEPDLAWAPDGSSLLVSDGDWIYRVDATPEGDLRENFVQLVEGASPSWQPLPAGSDPTPTVSPEPSISPDPEPEGKDVGLGFNLCESERLGGIDFVGDGTNGYAWVGVPSKDDGTCPKFYGAAAYVVAADADGDGEAETWNDLPWRCDVMCVAHDATDLDGNGTEELIVASAFSIMGYYVMTYLGPPDEPSPVIVPILVAEPGHEPVDLLPGEPLRIDAGGDEGYGSQIECEGYPEAPILVWSWSFSPVESGDPREVHITRIQLQADGRFHVVGTNDYTVPADQPSGIERSEAPACGVDFHPNT
jgi:Tol biopolymer transport system component